MDIAGKIKNLFSIGQNTAKNSMAPGVLANEFLQHGNRNRNGIMTSDWTSATMSDKDFYSGYSYAAINNRANKVSQLAIENIETEATKTIMDAARAKNTTLVHPYLTLIDESDGFTNSEFWYNISTYLDLEGVYYLMAVRSVSENLVGAIQSFTMINPYEVRRVINQDTMEVGGYVETRNGFQREIPPEMIIPIRKFNPFSKDANFAMTDAAKESQFTIKQAGDFTRSALKNNLSAPGIISTDVILDPERFANFQSRVVSQEKGLPLFANGTGAINWDPMQIDIDKAALVDVNEISRSTLFAVSGVSKTTMGIEESGTTREVSKTQKDKFIEDHIMPQLQLIIDALNQDYKKYYKEEYKKTKYTLAIDNPTGADKDGEIKDVTIAQSSYDLYDLLLQNGYAADIAAKYAEGLITLEELGEPTLEPAMTAAEIAAAATTTPKDSTNGTIS